MSVIDFNDALPPGHALRQDVDAEDVKARITAQAESFVRWLFSGRAHIARGEARIGDVMGTPGGSLSIALVGEQAGQWFDHNTGEKGDLIALFSEFRGYSGGRNFSLAVREIAADFLGDAVTLTRDPKLPSMTERLSADRKRLGTTPRADYADLGAPVDTWKYHDLDGNMIASVVRYEPGGTPDSKTFRPYHYKTEGGERRWTWGAPAVRPLFRLNRIVAADTVVLCEGEKAAQALADSGIEATTAMQGAKAPIEKTDWSPLRGKTVIVWPDNDDPGRDYGTRVARHLTGLGCTVRMIQIPAGVMLKWDAADAVTEGRDVSALIDGAVSVTGPEPSTAPLILHAGEFVRGFRPPDYLFDGILQRSYLYSATARTGAGKTAVAMYAAQAVARFGQTFAGREVQHGNVLYLAGENPDDIRARFLIQAHQMGFDPDTIPIHFRDGVIDIEGRMPDLHVAAQSVGGFALAVVDTVAAHYPGDDANNNVQQGAFARVLRQLTTLAGKPAVMALAHPVKNAARDNLLPVGGGAFLNEVDGNLTLWADADKQTTLHWGGKFRGPEFEPIGFRLPTVTSPHVVDSRGRMMPSVMAEPITEAEAVVAERQHSGEIRAVMFALDRLRGNGSVADIARAARLVSATGEPQKSKVQRILTRLKEERLTEVTLGKHRLSQKGMREIGVDDDGYASESGSTGRKKSFRSEE